LRAGRTFGRDGKHLGSAGIRAGIDLALWAMAAEDFGEEIAPKTARQLVL